MAVKCGLRCLLTILHALTGLGAGFFCVFSIFNWGYAKCLPGLIDQFGNKAPFKTSILGTCEILVYGTGIICLFSFITCFMNCLKQNACIAFINLLLAIIYITFVVMCGTAILVYYVVWCDTLQRKFIGSYGCEDAALRYDSYNHTGKMSLYKTHMEVQMASILALFPLIAIAVFTYSMRMCAFAKAGSRHEWLRNILHYEEIRPLLCREAALANYQTHSTNWPDTASESTNPFDD